MSEIAEKIIGTWQLVHSIEIDEQARKTFPFGEDATGYIIYDASGHMAVQICCRQRAAFAAAKFTGANATELAHIPKEYLAYFGKYKIDLENQLVRHFVEGSLFPNNIGKVLERKYHFYDDKMSLRPWDVINRELLWQKV